MPSSLRIILPYRSAELVATGLYSGYLPWSPGTAGSAICFALWLLLAPGSHAEHLLLLAATMIAAVFTIRKFLRVLQARGEKNKDPQCIVIDEWAGLLIALIGTLPGQTLQAVVAFMLFRLFDILKPGPVARLERLPAEWGVIADDAGAGLCALAALWLIRAAVA